MHEGEQVFAVAALAEEIAWRNGWIDATRLATLAEPFRKSGYGEYLLALMHDNIY